MKNPDDTRALIAALSRNLQPATKVWSPLMAATVWLAGSIAYVVVATLVLGPLREGWFDQLTSVPRFSIEMMAGVGATVLLAVGALRACVPGLTNTAFATWTAVLLLVWLGGFVAGLLGNPILAVGMSGKRDTCVWEAFVYAAPPLLAVLPMLRRRYALQPWRAAAMAGVAVGLMPAVIMQIACMYEPQHILVHHVGPALVISVIGASVIALVLTRFARQPLGSPRPGQM